MRSLAALDVGDARQGVLAALVHACLPSLLLAMLAALGPIASRRPAPAGGRLGGAAERSCGSGRHAAGLHPEVAAAAAALPERPPWCGYRTDVVAGLPPPTLPRPWLLEHHALHRTHGGPRGAQCWPTCCMHRPPYSTLSCAWKAPLCSWRSARCARSLWLCGPALQGPTRWSGIGVSHSSQVDDRSPWVREWALWGIRNLCEGSQAAQAAIQELQPQAPVSSPELQQLGMRVVLDRATGRFSLSPDSSANAAALRG